MDPMLVDQDLVQEQKAVYGVFTDQFGLSDVDALHPSEV